MFLTQDLPFHYISKLLHNLEATSKLTVRLQMCYTYTYMRSTNRGFMQDFFKLGGEGGGGGGSGDILYIYCCQNLFFFFLGGGGVPSAFPPLLSV